MSNRLHKFTGVMIGIAMVIVVGFITFSEERARSSAAAAASLAPVSNAGTMPVPSTAAPIVPAAAVVQTPPADVPKQTASIYKDGIYTATGSYMSPGGYDQITVTPTLANGIVTGASVVSGAGDGTSQRYQDKFISGYQPLVIGKDIASLSLSRVSGSSLTSIGFNDAVAQIKIAARS